MVNGALGESILVALKHAEQDKNQDPELALTQLHQTVEVIVRVLHLNQ